MGKQKFGTFLNENLLKMKCISNLLNPNPKTELVFLLSREEPEHSSVMRAKRALGTDFRTGWAVFLSSDRGGVCNLEACLSHPGTFFPSL